MVEQVHDGETEIILVDGYSVDKTLEIAKGYPNITVITEKPQGEPDAINKGMKLATGDIVTFLDGDDIYEPDALKIAEQYFSNPDLMWVYGKAHFINPEGQRIRRLITLAKEHLQKDYSYNKLCYLCFIAQPSVFMRREFQKKVGDYNPDKKLIFDYEYWLRAGKLADPTFIPEYLSSMRAHNGSISVKFSREQMQESLNIIKEFNKQNRYAYYVRYAILRSTEMYYKTVGGWL